MNQKQVIDLFEMKERRVRYRDGYKFTPKGRFAKLQKKVWDWAVAKKLVVHNYGTTTKVIRLVIDGDDLFDRIFRQYEGIMLSLREPALVLMGPDTFREVANCPQMQDFNGGPFSLQATGRIKRYRDQRGEMFNLPVRVIPHMEGCLILDQA